MSEMSVLTFGVMMRDRSAGLGTGVVTANYYTICIIKIFINVLLTSPRRMGNTQLVPKESSVILKIQINPAYVR